MGGALLHIDGGRGEIMLLAYLVAGLATFGAAFLPGNTPLYRVVCLVLGAAMSVWAGKVYLFGGTFYVNALVLLAPLALLVRGAIGAVGGLAARSATRAYLPPPRPHPAARQFGGPQSYQPHPPTAYVTVHDEYPVQRAHPFHLEPAADPAGLGLAPEYVPQHAARPRHAAAEPGVTPDPNPGRARHRVY
ncbi:hypothetical protein [Dactylosporangium sp. CA-233914]|uniref:hypothetical protein n=1 Tax=Dactylosporangium sp. CA-233914 TaxID=3239934 RepID=UPI003D8F54F4